MVAEDRGHETSCWIWQQALATNGYGRARAGGREVGAHRLSYEAHVGPIPDGLDIDHLCRVRACVNPDHLEPVTRQENLLRGDTHAARNAAKTHCKRGHRFSPENTYIRKSGGRKCKACTYAALGYVFVPPE